MPILKDASVELRRRLLELFPVANIRSSFATKGSKEEVAATLAKPSDAVSIAKIAQFIDVSMALCKQHIYVFEHDGDATLPDEFAGAERVVTGDSHGLYIIEREYKVVMMGEPPKNGNISFLWPIRIELKEKYVLVRFAVLEKNIADYFEGSIVVRSKTPSEEVMVTSLLSDGTVFAADLNKGIKTLWAKDLIDAKSLKYDMPDSSDSKKMNEAKELKKTNPAVYEDVRKRPLRMCTFVAHGTHSEVGQFSVSPTDGFIGFTHYAKEGSNGDALIQQILAGN